MKKVLIAQELQGALVRQNSFLNRADISVYTASSTDEVLSVHRREVVSLIVIPLDLPGTTIEQVCATLRADALLREAQLIVIAPNTREAIEQASRCRPNAVILRPVNPASSLPASSSSSPWPRGRTTAC